MSVDVHVPLPAIVDTTPARERDRTLHPLNSAMMTLPELSHATPRGELNVAVATGPSTDDAAPVPAIVVTEHPWALGVGVGVLVEVEVAETVDVGETDGETPGVLLTDGDAVIDEEGQTVLRTMPPDASVK